MVCARVGWPRAKASSVSPGVSLAWTPIIYSLTTETALESVSHGLYSVLT